MNGTEGGRAPRPFITRGGLGESYKLVYDYISLEYIDDPLLYGQKAIFRKTIIRSQKKFNRNEVVLMMLSNTFFKNSTPSIFALPHSKMTKTLNFHASHLLFHPHDHPLVFTIASYTCATTTYTKQIMSECPHREHSSLLSGQI